jgi:FG-GAP repeat
MNASLLAIRKSTRFFQGESIMFFHSSLQKFFGVRANRQTKADHRRRARRCGRLSFDSLESRRLLAVTAGDFNGDGYDDLAIGYPGENVTVDIGDGGFASDYSDADASPLAEIRSRIITGRGGAGVGNATWTGSGINSSAAATDPDAFSVAYADNASLPLGPYTNFLGQAVDESTVLVRLTRTGDANLDGVVNDDDVTIFGAHYAPGVPNPHWAHGDFDYNGFVDDDDVTLFGALYDPGAVPHAPPVEENSLLDLLAEAVTAQTSPEQTTLASFAQSSNRRQQSADNLWANW